MCVNAMHIGQVCCSTCTHQHTVQQMDKQCFLPVPRCDNLPIVLCPLRAGRESAVCGGSLPNRLGPSLGRWVSDPASLLASCRLGLVERSLLKPGDAESSGLLIAELLACMLATTFSLRMFRPCVVFSIPRSKCSPSPRVLAGLSSVICRYFSNAKSITLSGTDMVAWPQLGDMSRARAEDDVRHNLNGRNETARKGKEHNHHTV